MIENDALEQLADTSGTLELQGSYHDGAWGVTIQAFQHGAETHDPGDETGIGRGSGGTLTHALEVAVDDWQAVRKAGA